MNAVDKAREAKDKGAHLLEKGKTEAALKEFQRAVELVGQRISPQARIIWGCTVDPTLEKSVNILLVLTGVKSKQFVESHGPSVVTGRPPQNDAFEEVR